MDIPTLNQKEVLNELGIAWKKLKEFEKSGKIRAVRISLGTVRYFTEDIEKLKKERGENQNG